MSTIKYINYLQVADREINKSGKLSGYQKYHLWRYFRSQLPCLFLYAPPVSPGHILLDLLQEDIALIEGIAIDNYRERIEIKGVKLNLSLDGSRLYDGYFYRVYYLRRSKILLTYEQLQLKAKRK